MNLQSGKYYWPATFPDAPSYQALEEDLNCDVLIISGGSSAAQCAYYLADTHLDVVVLEKGKLGSGSTSTNTALIQYSGEKMVIDLINTFEKDYISRHLQLLREAINEIETASKMVEIDCEFSRRDTLYSASCKEDVVSLKAEYELLKQYGFELTFMTKNAIETNYPFNRGTDTYSYNDEELNPFKFTHTLFDYAAKQNICIYENTEMNGHHYDQQQERMIITTKTGKSTHTRRVIFAAGYEGIESKKRKRPPLLVHTR